MFCPKCGHAVVATAACSQCGLAAAKRDGYRRPAPAVSHELRAAFAAARAKWHDEATHLALRQKASQRSEHEGLVALYQDVGDAIAMKQMRAVATMLAAERLVSVPRPERPTPSLGRAVVVGLLLLVATISIALWTYSVSGSKPRPAKQPRPTVRL